MNADDPRWSTQRNLWLATVRPDGRPHLVPIWFVWKDGLCYLCTQESVKLRNIRANPRVSISLEDGDKPLIGEGTARTREPAELPEVADMFQRKYGWDLRTDPGYNTLIEIAVARWLRW